MTVIAVILVFLVTLITVLALQGSAFQTVCQVENPTVTVDDSTIFVEWTNVACAARIEIAHYVNDDLYGERIIPSPWPLVHLDRVECSLNKIVITTIPSNENSFTSGSESKFFEIELSGETKVQNLVFNAIAGRFEWEGPPAPEHCDLQYIVEFTNGDPSDDISVKIREEYFEPEIHYCTNNHVTVTTWMGLLERNAGSESAKHIEPASGDGTVKELRFNPSNRQFEWEAPENYDRCQLVYLVSLYYGEDETTIETNVEYHEFHLHPCTNNYVTVQTLIGFEEGREGGSASITHDELAPGDGEVENLHFNPTNRRFEWQAPESYERCRLSYFISFYNGDSYDEITTTDEYYKFHIYYCTTNHITVQTLIGFEDNREGAIQTAYHDESVPAVREISDLKFNVDKSRFEWEAPENSRLCGVVYEVIFQNEIGTIEETVSEQYFDVDPVPCATNHISVTTIIDTYRSNEVESKHVDLLERPYAKHISTNPQVNSVDVEWYIDHEAPGCEIEKLQFMIGVKGENQMESHYVDFTDSEDTVTATLDELDPDKLYEHTLCFVFSIGPDDPQCSDTVVFRTVQLTPPELELYLRIGESIDITWYQGYDPQFVEGHTLTITPISPLHFLPDSCEEEWAADVVREFFEPDVHEFHFEYGLPSFKYKIIVTTEFTTLGMQKTGSGEVETTEDKPGKLAVTTYFEYEPAAPYNVALRAQWGVPCNINGNIKRFIYTLKGTPKTDIVGICTEMTFPPGVVDIDDPHPEQFSLEVPELLPFFEYSLEIETTLEKDNTGVTNVDVDGIPQAHNPPDLP